jgi:hypothetical protein
LAVNSVGIDPFAIIQRDSVYDDHAIGMTLQFSFPLGLAASG